MKFEHHWHFQYIAYQSKNDKGEFLESTIVEVLEASTEAEALAMVKKKIRRNGYHLKEAWQCIACVETISRRALDMTSMKLHYSRQGK